MKSMISGVRNSFSLMGRILLLATLLASQTTFAAGGNASADTPAVSLIIVDRSESAFILFLAIPSDLDETKLAEIREKVAEEPDVTLLDWGGFMAALDGYLESIRLRNDYPRYDIKAGIVCLLEATPGAPWGITWNGGVALTYNDYQHARNSYRAYLDDPDGYQPVGDPRRDPVNPGGHLPAFDCMR